MTRRLYIDFKLPGKLARRYAVVAVPECCLSVAFIKAHGSYQTITNIFLSQSQVKVSC